MPNDFPFCISKKNVSHSLHLIVVSTVHTIAFANLTSLVVSLYFIQRFNMMDFWHSDCHRIIMPSRSIGWWMCSRVWYPVEWSAISSERWWINTPPETHECHMSPEKGAILKGKVVGSNHYFSQNWISCYCFSSLVGENDFMIWLRFPNPFGEKNETKVPFVQRMDRGDVHRFHLDPRIQIFLGSLFGI